MKQIFNICDEPGKAHLLSSLILMGAEGDPRGVEVSAICGVAVWEHAPHVLGHPNVCCTGESSDDGASAQGVENSACTVSSIAK